MVQPTTSDNGAKAKNIDASHSMTASTDPSWSKRDPYASASSADSDSTNATNQEVSVPSVPKSGPRLSSFKMPRTLVLRTVFVLSLIVCAILCASISYKVISNLETDVGKQTYESVATSALNGAQAITRRKLHGTHVMASILSYAFPKATLWPYVSMSGYTELNKELAAMSQSNEHGFIPFIDPSQVDVEEWQDFQAKKYSEKNFEDHVGYSDFGFGIWKKDFDDDPKYEDGRLPDVLSNDYGGTSNFTILAPIVEIGHKKSTNMLFNLRSEPFRRATVDSVLDCANYGKASMRRKMATEMPKCTVLSDMIELLHVKGPAGLIYTPVYPEDDPTTVVGLTSSVILWKQVLENIVPDYVDGLMCVISTPSQAWTFEIQEGVPVLLGEGDLHHQDYDHLAKQIILDDIETEATASAVYTLTVYPTGTMMNAFQSKSPLVAAVAFVAAIALCTCIFFIYDLFMRDEVARRQKIMEIKRQYVRFISHEIRTPLNTVFMALELLEAELRPKKEHSQVPPTEASAQINSNGSKASDTKDDDEDLLHGIVLDAQENSHTAVEVLNDLLQYDKIENQSLSLEIERVPILQLVEKTVHHFQVQALNAHLNLKFITESQELSASNHNDLEAGAVTCNSQSTTDLRCFSVIGDELRIGQVLRNLISNALKFTPEKGKIEVRARHVLNGLSHAEIPTEDDNREDKSEGAPRCGSIHIQVKDSGVGLTTDQLKQMFQDGVQFDVNKLQHGGGSGLGLVIAKGIVEQHGGTIHVTSEGKGKGTRFHVELPLYQIAPRQEETPIQTVSASAHTEAPRERRILVVDDVLSNRKMLVRLLERCGHTCETAGDGEEAVQAICRDMKQEGKDDHVPFDTVLMDFEMPVMSGPEATAAIRGLGYQGIIMGITGNVLQEDTDHFRSKGANEILSKPISIARLKESWAKLSPYTQLDGTTDFA